MCPITTPFINTDDLQKFALFLRNDCSKYTDAAFVENLITAIEQHPGANKDVVDRWLRAAFQFKPIFEDNNCIDIYNMSLYHQILEKI